MLRKRITMIAATFGVDAICRCQQPFDLDPSFVTIIGTQGVGSAALLEDGDVLLSGSIKIPGDQYDRSTARLNPDGSRDIGYPEVTYGGGKLVAQVQITAGHVCRGPASRWDPGEHREVHQCALSHVE